MTWFACTRGPDRVSVLNQGHHSPPGGALQSDPRSAWKKNRFQLRTQAYWENMPLIIICGFPCSGKSRRARELRDYFRENTNKHVEVIGDEMRTADKNSVYAGELQWHEFSIANYVATFKYLKQISESLWYFSLLNPSQWTFNISLKSWLICCVNTL